MKEKQRKTSEIIRQLRKSRNLSQEQLAEKLSVTRQAISRWENEETRPDTDTLLLLSKEFGISVDALLASQEIHYCQCCGYPLSHIEEISRELDGSYNDEYCKYCYAEGEFVYKDIGQLVDFLVENFEDSQDRSKEERKEETRKYLLQLNHWKQEGQSEKNQ